MEPPTPDPRLNRSLERLPTSQAPRGLPPRVTDADHRMSSPRWYQREWRQWPVGWQATSCAGGIGAVVLMLGMRPTDLLLSQTGTAAAGAVDGAGPVEPTVAALLMLWRVVFEPFVPMVVAVVLVMAAASVAIGLLLTYVVSGRTWQR